MNTRTFTAAAFAVVLSTSLATAQEQSGAAAQPQTGTQPGMSATQPGTQPGAATTQPGAAGAQQAGAAGQQFTDAKSFVREELHEQKILTDIYQMAQEKAESDDVKKVAKQALQDHKQAGDKLKEIAKEMNIEVKDEQPQAAADPHVQQAKQIKDRLQNLSGKEFDRAFLNSIASLHQLEINRYQAASTQAQEQPVKEFAQNTLPKLQEHFQASRQAFQEVTGTAWTPGQQAFMPAARYETQPGQHGATAPGTTGQRAPGAAGQPSPGAAGQPGSPTTERGTER